MEDYVVKVIASGPDFRYKKGWRWVKGSVEIKKEFHIFIRGCASPITFDFPSS